MNAKKSVEPVLELKGVGKSFGNVVALRDVDLAVYPGQVTCVLGDNGAGKSTLIKILSGVHQQSEGEFTLAGQKTEFNSPRDAMAKGIATVFQDLATVPLMSVWRNFFLGNEPKKWWKPLGILDTKFAKETAKTELMNMGIDLRDTNQAIGTLSGGERQAVAIARAVYFGATDNTLTPGVQISASGGGSLMTLLNAGVIGVGVTSPTLSSGVGIHSEGSTFRLAQSRTPASSTATGNTGEICWDANYVYLCVNTNTWRRLAHSTW
jgi:ABC-type lipoprotein export system ATPase subunit